ncbi:OsmC family protein [Cumulibacter manganitolerans]|uniref:OsmC family protein n=1 Tax=Cumulibacter manganitolerans TaxID=1884992 RepID=UPI001E5B9B65|nr:OsmC family protein [Cumulibacter manganitolerans]
MSSTELIDPVALRGRQKPLKDAYREDPASAIVVSTARAVIDPDSLSATVSTWAGDVRAGLHPAAGGDGSEACSGDILLEAVAACAGVTLRSVAVAMGVPFRSAEVRVRGTWDARGTLGVDRAAPVGLTDIVLELDIDSDAEDKTIDKLMELTERYCVVAQTLAEPPTVTFTRAG